MQSAIKRMIDINLLWQRYLNDADAEALVEIFELLRPRMQAVAIQVTGNAADAEDAIQQSIQQLLHRQPNTAVASVQPWLMGVVLNQARMIVRRETRIHSRQKQKEKEMQNSVQDPAALVEQQETVSLIQNIISELPMHYREPLVLHHIEGMNFSSIADALGRNEETVKKQSQRGVAMMRKLMRKRGLSVAMVLLVSVLQRLGATEHEGFVYSELATPMELPPWWQVVNPAVPALTGLLIILSYLLIIQGTETLPADHARLAMPHQESIPVVEDTVPSDTKPWLQAKFSQVTTCPFGELEKMNGPAVDAIEPVAAAQAILDHEYWIFKPKGHNPTMFETKRLNLPKEFHLQFEFKHHELGAFKGMQHTVYLGFFFNRSRKKYTAETIQKPDDAFTASILSAKDKWHTVDIEISIPNQQEPQLREITYSINGHVHWRARSNIHSSDIIPIGVANTAIVMRRFQYLDINAIN